jgi:predicted nucleotidyltransferase
MGQNIQDILDEYRKGLTDVLGQRLARVVLYGSYARGDAQEGADIDVLCVITDTFDYGDLIDMTSEVTARVSLKYGVTLSRTFVTRREFETRTIPFLMNIRQEGVRL